MKYQKGERCYIIINNSYIDEVEIIQNSNGFCIIKFVDTSKGIRIRESRLYKDKAQAEEILAAKKLKCPENRKNPWGI